MILQIDKETMDKAYKATRMLKLYKLPIIRHVISIRHWWMDYIWPFRKAYPLRVSSHRLVMCFRRRKAA